MQAQQVEQRHDRRTARQRLAVMQRQRQIVCSPLRRELTAVEFPIAQRDQDVVGGAAVEQQALDAAQHRADLARRVGCFDPVDSVLRAGVLRLGTQQFGGEMAQRGLARVRRRGEGDDVERLAAFLMRRL